MRKRAMVMWLLWAWALGMVRGGKCPDWGELLSGKAPPPPPLSIGWDDFGTTPRIVPTSEGLLFLPESLEPRPATVPDGATSRPRRVVVNYARGCCRISQHRNCISALKYGADLCLALNESTLSPAFVRRNAYTLAQPRGAGYWIWKPYIILKTLLRLDEGDMVMYSDAAQDFIADVAPLFDDAAASPHHVMVGWAQWYNNSHWTKRDAFLLLGCTDEALCAFGHQVQASLAVFRRTEVSLGLLTKWLAYAQDPRVLTDDENSLGFPNFAEVTWHRHDQSVISLLAALYGLRAMNAYHDVVYGLEFNCTVFHHRVRV